MDESSDFIRKIESGDITEFYLYHTSEHVKHKCLYINTIIHRERYDLLDKLLPYINADAVDNNGLNLLNYCFRRCKDYNLDTFLFIVRNIEIDTCSIKNRILIHVISEMYEDIYTYHVDKVMYMCDELIKLGADLFVNSNIRGSVSVINIILAEEIEKGKSLGFIKYIMDRCTISNFMYAISHYNYDMIEFVLNNLIGDINDVERDMGYNAMHHAVNVKAVDADITELLTAHGAHL